MNCDTPRRRKLALDDYHEGVLARDMAILPRAMTLVESSRGQDQRLAIELMTRLLPHTGGAMRVGITGVPGVGKSTFIDAVGSKLARQGRRIAVLAVDPSSTVRGGSILGDKTRMRELSAHANVLIRPSPTSGTLGGVARMTREMMLVCEAAGFEVVIVETVGVGQSETIVHDMTDCFLALMLPGAGDELQAIKRGLLELVDVIAVNKADGEARGAAEVAAQQLRGTLSYLSQGGDASVSVVTCSGLNREGADEVWQLVEECYGGRKSSGDRNQRRRQQSVRWLWSIVHERLRQRVHGHTEVRAISEKLEQDVLDGNVAPEDAAWQILDAFGGGE